MVALIIAFALLLAACGSPAPPPQQPPLPVPAAGWAITEWGVGGVQQGPIPLPSPSFQLPTGSASINWISYVELAWRTPLAGSGLKLDYTVTGLDPVFVNDSGRGTAADNSVAGCGGGMGGTLRLLIHQLGDQGLLLQSSYRWFSQQQTPLALGTFSVTIPLQMSSWINVNGQSSDTVGWAGAVANPAAIGFGLGGGCFAAHGVAVSSGSATITVNGLSLQ